MKNKTKKSKYSPVENRRKEMKIRKCRQYKDKQQTRDSRNNENEKLKPEASDTQMKQCE